MDWISGNLVALLAFGVSVYSLILSYDANKRSKRKEERETKIQLKISCEFDFYNQNVMQIQGNNVIGQGIRFLLTIENYGLRHAPLEKVLLMEKNDSFIKPLHEFKLNANVPKIISSTQSQSITLWLEKKKLKEMIGTNQPKNVFIRVISSEQNFFDSKTEKVLAGS